LTASYHPAGLLFVQEGTMVDRLGSLTRDRRALGLVLVLVLVIGVALFARSRNDGGTEQEQAQEAVNEGLAAHEAGDLQAAEDAYRRALELDPQNQFAYYNLGVIRQAQGDLEDAETNYRIAVGIDPDFAAALFNLAIIRADAGAAEEAIGLYEHIVEVTPIEDADPATVRLVAAAHLNLGFLLIDQGDEAAGQAELDEAVRLDPTLEERIGSDAADGETG
jgi:tetratricopeptide (TPR) repeat protein